MSPSTPTISDLNQVLADAPFLQSYGFRVESTAPGECTLQVPFLRSLERPGGIVSDHVLAGGGMRRLASNAPWRGGDDDLPKHAEAATT